MVLYHYFSCWFGLRPIS